MQQITMKHFILLNHPVKILVNIVILHGLCRCCHLASSTGCLPIVGFDIAEIFQPGLPTRLELCMFSEMSRVSEFICIFMRSQFNFLKITVSQHSSISLWREKPLKRKFSILTRPVIPKNSCANKKIRTECVSTKLFFRFSMVGASEKEKFLKFFLPLLFESNLKTESFDV